MVVDKAWRARTDYVGLEYLRLFDYFSHLNPLPLPTHVAWSNDWVWIVETPPGRLRGCWTTQYPVAWVWDVRKLASILRDASSSFRDNPEVARHIAATLTSMCLDFWDIRKVFNRSLKPSYKPVKRYWQIKDVENNDMFKKQMEEKYVLQQPIRT